MTNNKRTGVSKKKNSELLQSVQDSEQKFLASKAAKQETVLCLQSLVHKYETQYHDELCGLVESQGGDIDLINQYDELRERYFHSLLLVMKLQCQLTAGITVDIRPEDVFESFDNVSPEQWPNMIENLLLVEAKEKTAH